MRDVGKFIAKAWGWLKDASNSMAVMALTSVAGFIIDSLPTAVAIAIVLVIVMLLIPIISKVLPPQGQQVTEDPSRTSDAKLTQSENKPANFGNEVGGDRLTEAKAKAHKAFIEGNLSEAYERYAVVEDIADKYSAEAAYRQGEIAIRQAEAHFEKAARLDPTLTRSPARRTGDQHERCR